MPINPFDNYPMTWKPNRDKLKRPIYMSLANMLEQDIADGFLKPGIKLPPQRELADFLDINFTTVTRSYRICELKGLIYAKVGSGTFVSPNATRYITISTDKVSIDCIDLGIVASFEQCNHLTLDCIRNVTDKHYLEFLLNYNDPTGILHQKIAGINWMKSFGIKATPEQIAIVSGTQNALAIALFALFTPGNRIAVDFFTYTNFIELAQLYHIHLVPIRGDSEGMCPDELDNQCRLNGIHGLFLMPSCSNPTTQMISNKRKNELADIIRKWNLILIEDDMYAFLTAGIIADYKQPMFSLVPEQTVYICGTTKSICSGLRVAYMVFGENFKNKINKAIFNINVKTSSLNVEIITELINSGQAEVIVNEKKILAQQANNLYYEYFIDAPRTGHLLSFFRWLPLPENCNGIKLEEELLKNRVRAFCSDRFLCGSNSKEQFLRISFSAVTSMEYLEKGLKIIRDSIILLASDR